MDAIDNVFDDLMLLPPEERIRSFTLAKKIADLETGQREELDRTIARVERFIENHVAPDKEAEFEFRPADTRRRGRPRGSKNKQAAA